MQCRNLRVASSERFRQAVHLVAGLPCLRRRRNPLREQRLLPALHCCHLCEKRSGVNDTVCSCFPGRLFLKGPSPKHCTEVIASPAALNLPSS